MTTTTANNVPDHAADAPVQSFAHCHAGIVRRLQGLRELPQLQEAAQRARAAARDVLDLFDGQVLEHHAEEEDQLFDAVLQSAAPGAERTRVAELVRRLTTEHRELEATWKRLRPQVQLAAAGRNAAVPSGEAALLVTRYEAHARAEETEFLPLASEILGRNGNHMAALGLALHLRHAQVPVGYI